jgi:hypothetical protein
MTPMAAGRTMLRETRADVLAFPGFIAVVMIVAFIRVLTARHPQTAAIVICVALLLADIFLFWYLPRTGRASFVVTADDITFTPRQGRGHQGARPQVLHRSPGTTTLSFHLQDNGFVGTQQVYRLKLRDDATGNEIAATPFGRVKVRRACESQGWTFS